MSKRRPLIAGNWKLNGTRQSVVELARAVCAGTEAIVDSADILVCPTMLHMSDVSAALAGSNIKLGAQNCSSQANGAFTGEVSAAMLLEYGCQYVILGHSERRALFSEDSAVVAAKCMTALQAGITPVLCVGETLTQRQADQVETVISEQLDALLDLGGVSAFSTLVVAYEPVWAIGTGETATPEQAQSVHSLIRQKIAAHDNTIAESLQILYGGSVKPDNASLLFAQPDIDGGLIGGAALDASSFLAICSSAT